MDIKSELESFLREKGADLVGIADLEPLKSGLPTIPDDLLEPFTRAVSVAMVLDDGIIEDIIDRPTVEYAQHYREVNAALDALTAKAVRWINGRGYKAQAVPASEKLDKENLLGSVSHKAVARMAGLGWQGKSLLIVSSEHGPRIRLATVLTDVPLASDGPVENGCGECTACADACPVAAIKGVSTESHYPSREDAIYLKRCYHRALENREAPGIGALICCVCVKACPFGQ